MCGIALIISGVRIDLSSLLPDVASQLTEAVKPAEHSKISVEGLKEALQRRGPDHLGSKKLFLQIKNESFLNVEQVTEMVMSTDTIITSSYDLKQDNGIDGINSVAELDFMGAELQLRGISPVFQPLVDASGNILVYNGEIFGGLYVDNDCNDAEILVRALGKCCSCTYQERKSACCCVEKEEISVPQLLSTIRGPWGLIYWQDRSKTLWFGRDAFGRRSLLVHWPTLDDPRLMLSSVSPSSDTNENFDSGAEDLVSGINFWEELSCGIYSICFNASETKECLVGEVKKHEWTDPLLSELIKWERSDVEPKGIIPPSVSLPVQKVLNVLRESVMRRTILNTVFQEIKHETRVETFVPIAVLFSGGIDSMILAALLDQCLDPSYDIDLLNVSFDGQSAPDRISSRAGVKELQRIAPSRRWNLVEIDHELSNLICETKHVMSLIYPSNTYMDLNIGIALWLAAGGDGWVEKDNHHRVKYKSEAKILLVGSGADEQCAGYSRYRTKYRSGGWLGLHKEMKLDMQRIWKRNLGRDDRCISDNGKEARFPFLDEDVIKTLLEIPLWEVADLEQAAGKGDKKILREVAQLLGLEAAAFLPKRAIQFGSRIARESNRKNFGSNRAANQASAGSVVIHNPSTK
ncbi:asparagine synthetase domain-containing protein 1-like [Papaver somniferum]|uniref:asparagine synthetase domain-containing protein 1-like n=1 Tax=Papaver somniferum TaxID=3469 RepID=UPI000E700C24|nr:asparagine synthetase domain-containing protein 1-like [Papaver somniferum]